MTISDLVNEAQLLGFSGILEQSLKNADLGDIIVPKWDGEIDNIDMYIQYYYSDRQIFETIEQFTSPVIRALILSKKYEYDKLYDTLLLDYNPIENYNRTETSNTTNVNGKRKRTVTTHADNRLDGERADTTTIGATTDTINEGQQTNSDTTTQSNNPYDSSSFYDTSKTSGSSTIGAKQTTNNIGKRETTSNITTKDVATTVGTDIASDDESTDTATITSNISGNIGVTTTQDMIRAEREVSNFSFVKKVAIDVVNAISNGVWCAL